MTVKVSQDVLDAIEAAKADGRVTEGGKADAPAPEPHRGEKPAAQSEGLALTFLALNRQGVMPPEEEYRFHPTRRFRFDFAWPEKRVAFEQEGVTRQGGRHQRVAGYSRDCEKYNLAQILGWVVIRATPKQIASGEALGWLEQAFGLKVEVGDA